MTVPETLKAARLAGMWTTRGVGAQIGRSHQIVHLAEKDVKNIGKDGVLLSQLCEFYGLDHSALYEQLKAEKAANK